MVVDILPPVYVKHCNTWLIEALQLLYWSYNIVLTLLKSHYMFCLSNLVTASVFQIYMVFFVLF